MTPTPKQRTDAFRAFEERVKSGRGPPWPDVARSLKQHAQFAPMARPSLWERLKRWWYSR